MFKSKLFLLLLIFGSTNYSWSQSDLNESGTPALKVLHTHFNSNEGTIDFICKPYDIKWAENLAFHKEALTVRLNQPGSNIDSAMLVTKAVLPMIYYRSDFQPEPVPPPSVMVLWDLGMSRQKGAIKTAKNTLKRMINSEILGYSPIQIVAFDTILKYQTKEAHIAAIDSLSYIIEQNDSLGPITDWENALLGFDFTAFDILVLLTDGGRDTMDRAILPDTSFATFFTQPIFADKQIFPIGFGPQQNSQAFQRITEHTIHKDEWTDKGRIPISMAQKSSELSEDDNDLMVLQCVPDAMLNLDERAFSIAPIMFDISFKNEFVTSFTEHAGNFVRPVSLQHNTTDINGLIYLCVFAFIVIGVIIFLVPMRHRYNFKKKHVFLYQDIEGEEEDIDPVTLVPIEEDEQVVLVQDRMMTLKTWKSIKAKPDHPVYKEYEDFFDDRYTGHLFGLQLKGTHPVQTAWYGLTGGALSWLIIELAYVQPFNLLITIQTALLKLGWEGIWIDLPIALWTAVAITLGVFSVPVILRFQKFSMSQLPIFSFVFFAVSYMICAYFLQLFSLNAWLGSFLFWAFVGLTLAFLLSVTHRESFVKRIPDSIILAIGGVVFFQLIGYIVLTDVWQVGLRAASLVSFMLFGLLFGILSPKGNGAIDETTEGFILHTVQTKEEVLI